MFIDKCPPPLFVFINGYVDKLNISPIGQLQRIQLWFLYNTRDTPGCPKGYKMCFSGDALQLKLFVILINQIFSFTLIPESFYDFKTEFYSS